ncbi:MAG TPA: FAA hydrolase family protein [Flavobacteriales bacterium]|jgi:2-keto-4-pentenoate hydratase/2-oxohepta-3-ene-1,7-dioic acid hydratase in catechol pathway|nr:FAA hydrolase family protein [Flavobacteriales bacterium]HHZ97565.1 FAA hydrolase family protein [Flavobacteriales bacterium]HIB77856.1 FAA hydrolase family protein [Flavobacteriales bacterium]HIO15312.1 FAA hydrolase family protein [Flavobacteriales bacterium]HIO58767.1 FAA hydrolase family protein [Flavobacteriales bacterium]
MKIICIGRNYHEHALELGNEPPKEPMFFLKPDSSVLHQRHAFYIPDWSKEVHYEVEVVVKIKKLGKAIQLKFASRYYDEIGLGIDFTARDVQKKLKEAGHPWEKAKSFDGAAVVSDKFYSLEDLGKNVQDLNFDLSINGVVVQSGNTSDMLFQVDELITYISKFMTLKTGDLIFTGTPAGVGMVNAGDHITGKLEGFQMLNVNVK